MYFHLELRGQHAGELSYVLGKHPDRLFEWDALGSMVRVFFPVYDSERARAVVLYWPDPLAVARRAVPRSAPVKDYVSPRPYSINSLFCAALKIAFNSAITGNRHAPPDVLNRSHDIHMMLSPVCTYLSPERVIGVFEPLGYKVKLERLPDRPEIEFELRHPRVYKLELEGHLRVAEALRHVFILTQVIDSDRHDHMDQADIERLQRFGSPWLEAHPERMFIISRYLIFRRLIDGYLQTTSGRADSETGDRSDDGYDATGEPHPARPQANAQRYQQIVDALMALPRPPARVLQMGCGDGRLLAELVSRGTLEEVVGVDASAQMLERARKRVDRAVRFSQALRRHPTRLDLLVSSLGYDDKRLHDYDAVVLCDVIEHLEETRLPFYLAPVLEQWKPRMLVIAVHNREWGGTPNERERGHGEIRTEWDRAGFRRFCESLAAGRGYGLQIHGVGQPAPDHGAPIQMAVFSRLGGAT